VSARSPPPNAPAQCSESSPISPHQGSIWPSSIGFQPDVTHQLAGFDIVWMRGGNVFVLRRALADSTPMMCWSADLIWRSAIVYAGYSAAACALAADLTRVQRFDNINAVANATDHRAGPARPPVRARARLPVIPSQSTATPWPPPIPRAGHPHRALRDDEVPVADDSDSKVPS
jgi:dipeptidase E